MRSDLCLRVKRVFSKLRAFPLTSGRKGKSVMLLPRRGTIKKASAVLLLPDVRKPRTNPVVCHPRSFFFPAVALKRKKKSRRTAEALFQPNESNLLSLSP